MTNAAGTWKGTAELPYPTGERTNRTMTQESDSSHFLVYLIGVGSGYIKIGVAKDVETRKRELQTGNHEELSIIHTVSCPDETTAYALELQVHTYLRAYRVRGEWFDVTPQQVLEAIDMAKADFAKPRRRSSVLRQMGDDFDRAAAWFPELPRSMRKRIPAFARKSREKQKLRDGDEVLIADAIELVQRLGKASISLFQRRLSVGYGRAARIYDALLERGVFEQYGIARIGPSGRQVDA
jgi:DNA segregation ATPase FtsK/SpoIIIE-like protein